MSTRQSIVTNISIVAVLFIGLLPLLAHRASIEEHEALLNRSIEIKLIQINNYAQSPSVNSANESDTQIRK
jgi:hypothetical protein